MDWSEAARRLSLGEVGVLPTDTMYGVVASALKPAAVERVYDLRRRELGKPMIVLIGGWEDLERFGMTVEPPTRGWLEKVWPGPVSVVLPAQGWGLEYLHRGTGGIAFRMPAKPQLRALLAAIGPIVAPSANLAGEAPARDVAEAKHYFGEDAFYLDEGELRNPPSALVDARVFPPKVLRPAHGFKIEKAFNLGAPNAAFAHRSSYRQPPDAAPIPFSRTADARGWAPTRGRRDYYVCSTGV